MEWLTSRAEMKYWRSLRGLGRKPEIIPGGAEGGLSSKEVPRPLSGFTREQNEMGQPSIQEVTQDLQSRLYKGANDLAAKRARAELLAQDLRVLEGDQELLKQQLFAEQVALGETGIFKGMKNAESRKAAFESYLPGNSEYQALVKKAGSKQLEVTNAKIESETARSLFDALRAVADLQSGLLRFEAEVLLAKAQGLQVEAMDSYLTGALAQLEASQNQLREQTVIAKLAEEQKAEAEEMLRKQEKEELPF